MDNKVCSYNSISCSNENEHTSATCNIMVKYDEPNVGLKKQDTKE